MAQYTLATYNIEHMRDLFYKGDFAPEGKERIDALAEGIRAIAPHVLGITEACHRETSHQRFSAHPLLAPLQYQVARNGGKRGSHDLVVYYRDPFRLISLDENISCYDSWIEDIDDDGIKEVCEFERVPLEALFEIGEGGPRVLLLLVSLKSKGVFAVGDFMEHQHLALANRKRQLAQATKVRRRLDDILRDQPNLPVVVMGDFNDEPGLDSYQRTLGASSVETIMGSVFAPLAVFHNVLWHMEQTGDSKNLWTAEYPDAIVATPGLHKAWLDHILVSPCLRDGTAPCSYVAFSGAIGEKNATSRKASDHYPVYCMLED